MFTAKSVICGLALAAAMAIPLNAQASNLIINGNFETLAEPVGPFGFATLSGGSTSLTGWTVTGNTIDVVPTAYWAPGDGNFSVDLDGTPGHGGITQSVATIPGQLYLLAFAFSVNPEAGLPGEINLPRVMDLNITASDNTVIHNEQYSGSAGLASKLNMNFSTDTVLFTALDSTTTFSFSSIGQTTYTGPVLDGVFLDFATGNPPPEGDGPGGVPEPASLSVLGLGAAGLLIRRRRNQK